MLVINEFLPNPSGRDGDGEFIELLNTGEIGLALDNFRLSDKSGKTFKLSGELAPRELLSLPFKTTKIILNNDTESVMLYNPNGELIDSASFLGAAPEGASFARHNGRFVFTETPTPGAENIISAAAKRGGELTPFAAGIIKNNLPFLELAIIGAVAALAIAAIFGFILKEKT